MKLEELARLAGVSRTTVSYVVNGKAKQYRVSERTIAKVEALIKEYDFKPNVMAAGLRAGRSNTIGLIVPDFENPSYAKIASQLERRCRKKGYQLLITYSEDNAENEMACAKHLFGRKIDALIVSTVLAEDSDFYTAFSPIPIIGFDRHLTADNIINVLADNKNDALRLAQELFKHKTYQRILFLGALPDLQISREREAGFRAALNGNANEVDFLYVPQFRKESAALECSRWLEQNPLPDAVFTTSQTLLQGLLQVLLRREQAIPSTLEIATFGDHEMLALLPNRVICSAQNYDKVVMALLELVMAKLKHKKANKSYKLSEEIIARDIIYRHH